MTAGYLLFRSFENNARETGKIEATQSSTLIMDPQSARYSQRDIPELNLLHTAHSRIGHDLRGKEKECNRAQRGEGRKG